MALFVKGLWVFVALGMALSVYYAVYLNSFPRKAGLLEGHLHRCFYSPNCVSSVEEPDDSHYVEPISVPPGVDAMSLIVEVISTFPRQKIIVKQENYIHAEFWSKVFRFVDDVEFHYQPELRLIQVRSAARLGYRDFGVNRDRIEAIRKRFAERAG